MERINFTMAVLGAKATARLREHQVTQTIRSGTSSLALAVNDGRLTPGDTIQITLDDELVGYARFTGMEKTSWKFRIAWHSQKRRASILICLRLDMESFLLKAGCLCRWRIFGNILRHS